MRWPSLTLVLVLIPVAALGGESRRGTRMTVAPDAIRVWDGDTFYVGAETFRLRGIDTPELHEPRGHAARERLRALLHSRQVVIVRRGHDVYGRSLADVYVTGRSVARRLRAEGFAKPSPRARPPPSDAHSQPSHSAGRSGRGARLCAR
jgi:endonuclease YncB( thermonuclease family)